MKPILLFKTVITMSLALISGGTYAGTFILNDGTVINGTIVQSNKNSVIIEDEKGSLRAIPNSNFIENNNSSAGSAVPNQKTTPFSQAQEMIDSNIILQKGGVQKLQSVTSGISSDWRYYLYARNLKWGSFGLTLDFFVPTLGNWIIGDYTGAIVGDFGIIGGLSLYTAGVYQNHADYAYYGLWTALCFSIYTWVSDIIFSGSYNKNLKDGLWLADAQSIQNQTLANARTASLSQNHSDLLSINILSYRF